MALSSDDKLGPYEILGLIGVGGMGEVYLARDPRLGRNVAIKVSAERFSERFEREARAVAALNHPNICTLHDVGPNYLVMEFVEGASPNGPLPLGEALRVARQITDALEAAHENGLAASMDSFRVRNSRGGFQETLAPSICCLPSSHAALEK